MGSALMKSGFIKGDLLLRYRCIQIVFQYVFCCILCRKKGEMYNVQECIRVKIIGPLHNCVM